MSPLDELRAIGLSISQATHVDDLRPLFERVGAISREHAGNFEVAIAADQTRRQLLDRANFLQIAAPAPPPPAERRVPGPAVVTGMGIAALLMLAYAGFLFYRVKTTPRPQPPPPVVAPTPAKPPTRGAVRVVSDFEAAVTLDGNPAGAVADGQFRASDLAPGPHTLALAVRGATASVAFDINDSGPPRLTAPPAVSNAMLVVVGAADGAARVYTPAPAKIALNGEASGEAGPDGLAVALPAGDQTLTIANRRLTVSGAGAPVLNVFFHKPEATLGMLVISTGEDDANVSLNGKPVRRKWSSGTIRVPALGDVTVHVDKAGFQPVDDQNTTVKRGEEVKLNFHLKPVPRLAALQVKGAAPGTEVWMDGQLLGRAGADGALAAGTLAPGAHSFELRREGFTPRRIQRTVKAGETLNFGAADVALAASSGSLQVKVAPANATVTVRRQDEAQSRPFDPAARLAPGNYVVAASAAGFETRSANVTIAAGEAHSVELQLAPIEPAKPRVALSWAGWSKEGSEFVRRGGNRAVVIAAAPPGVLRFTARVLKGGGLFRGGAKLRWFIEDDRGVTQYEIDRRRFQAKGPAGTHAEDTPPAEKDEEPRPFAIEVEITPDAVSQRLYAQGHWTTLDTRAVTAKAGLRFGFLVPASDEVAVSDLRFQPK